MVGDGGCESEVWRGVVRCTGGERSCGVLYTPVFSSSC